MYAPHGFIGFSGILRIYPAIVFIVRDLREEVPRGWRAGGVDNIVI